MVRDTDSSRILVVGQRVRVPTRALQLQNRRSVYIIFEDSDDKDPLHPDAILPFDASTHPCTRRRRPPRGQMERQVLEIEALAAVFSGDGEFETNWTNVRLVESAAQCEEPPDELPELACTLRMRVGPGEEASVTASLPRAYPAEAARLEVSWAAAGEADLHALGMELRAAAGAAAAEAGGGREVLTELAMLLQERCEAIVERRSEERPPVASGTSQHSVRASRARGVECASERGLRIIWFHHVKSLTKRKRIVAAAREAELSGFCKPGFPGVLVAAGRESELGPYVRELREMRWQAMDVRLEWREGGCEEGTDGDGTAPAWGADRAGGLPMPFVELDEGAMGEAAALCDAAGLGGSFRASVLKLDGGAAGN